MKKSLLASVFTVLALFTGYADNGTSPKASVLPQDSLKDCNYVYTTLTDDKGRFEWVGYDDHVEYSVLADNTVFRGTCGYNPQNIKGSGFEAEGKQICGHSSSGYGFMFGAQNLKNFYQFLITTNGYVCISKIQNGKAEILYNWQKSSWVKPGYNNANIFKVILGTDNNYYCYMNDHLEYVIKNPVWTYGSISAAGTCGDANTETGKNPKKLEYKFLKFQEQ